MYCVISVITEGVFRGGNDLGVSRTSLVLSGIVELSSIVERERE